MIMKTLKESEYLDEVKAVINLNVINALDYDQITLAYIQHELVNNLQSKGKEKVTTRKTSRIETLKII